MINFSGKKLYVIANSHMDPVWMWSRVSGRSTWLNTMHAAVDMMMRHPELKFTCSSTALYRYIEECSPELFEQIRQLVDAGRWEIVGGWEVQADTIVSDTESLLRQGIVGKKYIFEKFGVDVQIGFSPDSFGHSAHLPKILRATGFSHYVFLRPMTADTTLPLLFDWRSEDGSTVRALRIFDTYNYQNACKEEYMFRIRQHLTDGWDKQTFFLGTGDHGGGIYEKHLQWLKEASEELGFELVFSTLKEYFDDIKDEKIPIVENTELGPVFRGCYAACQEVKTKIATAMERLHIAERCGIPEEQLEESWCEVLFNHFHDVLSGTAILDAYERDVFPSLGGVISKMDMQIARTLHRRAESLDTSFQNEGGIFLWNPQAVPVTGEFSFPGFTDPNETGSDFNALRDADGTLYPLQILFNGQAGFAPCAAPWGKLTLTMPLEAGEEKLLAYARVPEGTFKNLGFESQYRLLKKISFPCFYDDHGTWGFALEKYLHPEAAAELIRTEEFADGPVCSILRSYFRVKHSEIRMDILRYAGIDELKINLRIDWHEPLRTLKIAVAHQQDIFAEFYTGTPGGLINRYAYPFPSQDETIRRVQINRGYREIMHPATGERCMNEWCAVISRDKSQNQALYSADLHSCDLADGAMRITLIRSVPYADHHPFPRNEETGYMDMGMNFRTIWYADIPEIPAAEIPGKARCRLSNAECIETTGHIPSSPVCIPEFPQISCSSNIVQEAARLRSDGHWEIHLLNYGENEMVKLPDGSSVLISAKELKILII